MDPSMEAVEIPELHLEQIHNDAHLTDHHQSYLHVESSSSMRTLHEQNPSAQWELPSILPKEVYKLKWYKYFFVTQIKVSSINILFIGQDEPI